MSDIDVTVTQPDPEPTPSATGDAGVTAGAADAKATMALRDIDGLEDELAGVKSRLDYLSEDNMRQGERLTELLGLATLITRLEARLAAVEAFVCEEDEAPATTTVAPSPDKKQKPKKERSEQPWAGTII